LDPNSPKGYATNTRTVFHGFPILGEVEIKNPTDRTALIDSLAKGLRRAMGWLPFVLILDTACA
jgi:hypothetical protein